MIMSLEKMAAKNGNFHMFRSDWVGSWYAHNPGSAEIGTIFYLKFLLEG